ncbi:heme o synthase [Chromohalobacter sp. TMW 2.2299]|uniref:Protoheme IX farnesyltransferase n=1 Tax=Chromohalobacter moromii TaxID=2860329 RepID=A0A9X2X013_9GAMM|nr:heme o synthase [Chromohalobacter moromii]MCT8467427.1 heme o synthase [Chromohalobacter canadensis]MCT8470825.1 heme o synthase [Chromohalobacter canadensis]MCT8497924.1 heme o synthase [Chromohalobacter canadensis]MCT8504392.1 heme o synthase [Chromohalobacter moromii]
MILKPYVSITKPGIIFGNLISVAGGFFLASQGSVDGVLFLATVIGIALVIASGCVFNNYIDRDIDRLMERTQGRVAVQGLISPGITLAYGSVLGVAGFLTLALGTNALATLFALLGFFVYVGLYSLYLKRHSVYGTLVGSLSGAAPPVVGYCAVSGQFDLGALTLLLIFCLWQMPHSYAIAIFRYQDYRAASIPVLPVTRGVRAAKHHIFWYILAFLGATLMLTLGGYAGYGYFAVAAAMGLYWLVMAFRGYRTGDDRVWAKKVFIFSIFTITALSIMMSIDFQVTDTEVLMTSLR